MDYRRENWALGLSSFGLILGPLGLGIGLYLASTSRRWSFGQKWAVVVIPAALVGIFWLVASPSGGYSCYQVNDEPEVCEPHASPLIPWLLLIALTATAVGTAIYLYRAARSSKT
jgi:hypothetical protein